MDFEHLNYFRTVARLGNLSQAAKELYISQPGLSRYLTKLEQEIGVPLFERRKGRIVLNTYGQIFLTNVNRAFDCLDYGLDTVQRLYFRDQNILSIACSIEDYLTDRLRDFSTVYPQIGIRQFSYSIPEIEIQLLRQNLDLAICAHPPQSDKLKYELLSQCPYVLVCCADTPLARTERLPLRAAAEQHFICENPRLNRRQLEEICKTHGFIPHISHEVESGYILYNLLESNVGVALTPLAHYLKINEHMPDHHLRAVFLDDELPMAEIGVMYLSNRPFSPAAVQFLSFLHLCSDKEIDIMQGIGTASALAHAEITRNDT